VLINVEHIRPLSKNYTSMTPIVEQATLDTIQALVDSQSNQEGSALLSQQKHKGLVIHVTGLYNPKTYQ
jgi:hypothetical protein